MAPIENDLTFDLKENSNSTHSPTPIPTYSPSTSSFPNNTKNYTPPDRSAAAPNHPRPSNPSSAHPPHNHSNTSNNRGNNTNAANQNKSGTLRGLSNVSPIGSSRDVRKSKR